MVIHNLYHKNHLYIWFFWIIFHKISNFIYHPEFFYLINPNQKNNDSAMEYFPTSLIMINHNILEFHNFHIFSEEIFLHKFFRKFQVQFWYDHYFFYIYLVFIWPIQSFFYNSQSFHLNIYLIKIFSL